jgi:N-acetylmuramic acid 6-phosphate etherase
VARKIATAPKPLAGALALRFNGRVSAGPLDDGVFEELAALVTEQPNPRTGGIDRAPVDEALALLNAEDALVAQAVAREIPHIARLVEIAAAKLGAGGRIVYVGAGTSGRLGVLDAAECPPTFGTDPSQVIGIMAGGDRAVFRSVEGAEDDAEAGGRAMDEASVGAADVVVGLAASRRTPFVAAALTRARALGAATALVTCAPRETVTLPVDVAVCPVVGPEAIMGSTRLKSGTAQKMVLNMVSTAAMIRLGKVYRNMMVDLRATSRKLRERSVRTLMVVTGQGRAEAARLLGDADGSVKTAIVMSKLALPRDVARARLDAAGGHVARALGEIA